MMQYFLFFMQYIVDIMYIILYYYIRYILIVKGEIKNWMKNLKLKAARIKKDLTQEELANKVGVTRQTIGLIENGKYNPTISLCLDICKMLDKTLDDLFWEEDTDE